jgi:tetratricopeptide (TPR) repeat protein
MGIKDRQGEALKKGGNPRALPLIDAAAMQTALDLAAGGKPDEAVKILEDVVRRNPGNATAPFNLGMLCYKTGNLAEAEKSFRKALARNPEGKRWRIWPGSGWTRARMRRGWSSGRRRSAIRCPQNHG